MNSIRRDSNSALSLSLSLIVVIASVIGASLTGCDSLFGSSPEEYFAKAKSYQEQGELQASVIELKNALRKAPDYAEARALLGRVYLALGQPKSASKEIRRARSLGVDDSELGLALVRALVIDAQYQDALAELAVLEDGNEEAQALVLEGRAHMGLGDEVKARQAFDRAISKDPASADAHIGLARVAWAKGDMNEVDRQLELALKADPQNFTGWLLKGERSMVQVDPVAAEQAFLHALENAKYNDIAPRLALARAKLGQRQPDAALDYLAAVRERVPHLPLFNYLRAVAAYQKSDLDQATDALREVMKVAPDHLPSMLLLGNVEYAQGKLERADDLLAHYVAAVPDNLPARKLLATVRLANKQPDTAIEALIPVAEEGSADPQFLALLGTAYMRDRQPGKASDYLERAAEMVPDAAAIRTQLALSHLASGATERAVSELETVVELKSDLIQADVLLMYAWLRQGKFDEVLAAADKLVTRDPENPVAYNLKGAAYLGKKDIPAARAQFEKALEVNPAFAPAALNLAALDLRDGDEDAARRRYQTLLQHDEHNAKILIALARLESRAGHAEEALGLIQQARQYNPDALEPRLILSTYYLQTRRFEEALALAKEAAQIQPSSAAVLVALGRAQRAAGKAKAAVASFQKVVARNPQSPDAYNELALAQAQAGMEQEARQAFQKALELSDGKNPRALAGLGLLEARAGNVGEAQELAKRLQQQYPDSPVGHTVEGDIYVAQKQYARAIKAYEAAPEGSWNSELVRRLYDARKLSGDEVGAEKTLADWLAKHPEDSAVRLALAADQLQTERKQEAITEYERLLAEQPDNPVALNNLAWLYREAGDPRALELAERAYKIAPQDPTIAATYARLIVSELEPAVELDGDSIPTEIVSALASLHEGKFDEALGAANALQRRNPRDPATYNLKGAIFLGKKDVPAAREQFERALQVDPAFAPAALNLAALELRDGNEDAARQRYRSLLKYDERNAKVLVALAQLESRAGHTEEALDLLQQSRQYNPNAVEPRLVLSAYYLQARRFGDALAVAKEAEQLQPTATAVLMVLGRAQLAAGEAKAAIASFQKVVERKPQDPGVYIQLAAAQARAGMEAEARQTYQKALALSEGKNLGALAGLADLEGRAGNMDKAQELVETLRQNYPDSPVGHALQGDVYIARKQYASAISAYETALAGDPSSELVLKLYNAHKLSGDEAGANKVLAGWVADHPDDNTVRLALAGVYMKSARKQQAIVEYERILAEQPDNPLVLNNLAWLYFETGDTRALNLAEGAYKAAPQRPAIADTYGWLLVQAGNVEHGISLLRNAAERMQDNPEVQYHLGVALARAGDKTEARKFLEAALRSGQAFGGKEEAERLLAELGS